MSTCTNRSRVLVWIYYEYECLSELNAAESNIAETDHLTAYVTRPAKKDHLPAYITRPDETDHLAAYITRPAKTDPGQTTDMLCQTQAS